MLSLLLHKDFLRLRRNPWPVLLNLALPLAITALVGLAFGGGKEGPSVAKIRVALLDEDDSVTGSLLKGGLSQGEAAKHFETLFVTNRAQATSLVRDDRVSAAIIIPPHFTKDYLTGKESLALEVIKNPAESIYPAMVEQILEVVVTVLNAAARNLHEELVSMESLLTNKVDVLEITALLSKMGQRMEGAKKYINPPLVTYHMATLHNEKSKKAGSGFNVFVLILPGMASAFLLFLADHAMRDLNGERRLHTLPRIMTATAGMKTFVAGKVIFAALNVFFGSAILFFASELVFRINWQREGLMTLACAAYSLFAAGFMAALVALVPNERRSERVNNMLLFTLAFLGGSYIPASSLPGWMQRQICPLMPNFWFSEAIRGLQRGGTDFAAPLWTVLKLGAAGVILALIASVILEKRITAGTRA